MACRACADRDDDDHQALHAVMDHMQAGLKAAQESLGGPMDATITIGAILSLVANIIDAVYRHDPAARTRELQKCEQFFSDEYVN